jgi:hypothetical protein
MLLLLLADSLCNDVVINARDVCNTLVAISNVAT